VGHTRKCVGEGVFKEYIGLTYYELFIFLRTF
jgi:hypothetical protein